MESNGEQKWGNLDCNSSSHAGLDGDDKPFEKAVHTGNNPRSLKGSASQATASWTYSRRGYLAHQIRVTLRKHNILCQSPN